LIEIAVERRYQQQYSGSDFLAAVEIVLPRWGEEKLPLTRIPFIRASTSYRSCMEDGI
jgi:hypothetical protein